MKAITYSVPGEPTVLEYVDLPDPVAGPGQLLVRVEAICIEGGDLLSRRSVKPPVQPHIPGYVAAGEVLALGEGVTGFVVGDKVATFGFVGSHASLRAVPAATSWALPAGIDMQTAAAALVGVGTAALALSLGEVKASDTVLVLGAAGGVGLAAVQVARLAGARVLGTGTNAKTLEALKGYGLETGLDVSQGPVGDLIGEAKIDLVIDNVGGQALTDALAVLREGGRAVLVGMMGEGAKTIDAVQIMTRRWKVSGCFLGPIMAEPAIYALVADGLAQVASGAIRVPIEGVYPLADAATAHVHAERRGRLGRVILQP